MEVWGHAPPGIFLYFNFLSPISWTYELFKQDIYWLPKPFSRFQLGKFKVFLIKIYLYYEKSDRFP